MFVKKRIIPFSAILVVALFAGHTFAQSADQCSTQVIDVSTLGAPRYQGERGWCYAYVAADLVSMAVGKKISADDVALEYEAGEYNCDIGPKKLY
jgi:hypothetical protein